MEKERIQKVLAASGQYSRREVERLIDEGKIKVNGVVIRQKGMKVHPIADRIQVAGKAFQAAVEEELRVLLINKPRRIVVTRKDEEGRPTVFDILPDEFRHFKPVGRLDCNSQGALLLTNDGDLILKMTHPRYHVPKVYEVKLSSHPNEKQLDRLRRGVVIDGERTLPADVEIKESNETSTVIVMTLRQGLNRQIRRMCEAVGLVVKELRRTAIGPIQLKGLRSGQFRELTKPEIKALQRRLRD